MKSNYREEKGESTEGDVGGGVVLGCNVISESILWLLLYAGGGGNHSLAAGSLVNYYSSYCKQKDKERIRRCTTEAQHVVCVVHFVSLVI